MAVKKQKKSARKAGIIISAVEEARQPNLILPMFSDGSKGFAKAGKAVASAAQKLAEIRKFQGREKETMLLPHQSQQWLFVGLGQQKKLTPLGFCEALGKGLSELRGAGAEGISLIFPDRLPMSPEEAARLSAEALCMAGYEFKGYRTKRGESGGKESCRVELVHPKGARALRPGLQKASQVWAGISLARDLINEPAAIANTEYMMEQARAVAQLTGSRYLEIKGANLLKKGYKALHAVGRSGGSPPALVALEYGRPAPKSRQKKLTLALVGKGVVFDCGGLDLKSSSGMGLMKKDMGGAAIVLGAFRAIAGLGLPVHLVAVLGLAENMVGPEAYRPGDVLHTKAGPTIEVTNTDAEGRIVLAEAFALAHQYQPHYMVDFATLTGACRVALGPDLMGLFCEDKNLREAILAGGNATGEYAWHLPLWQPYRKKLESRVADLTNNAPDGLAGAITAALFLKEFAGETPWAHLDCYGWSNGDNPLVPKGGSGSGVRLMVDLVTRLTGKGKK